MRRHLILALVILLLIPLVGVWTVTAMEDTAEQTQELLLQARQTGMTGDRSQAQELLRQAREAWKKREHLAACIWDHEVLDEIALDFRVLEAAEQESGEFDRLCLELTQRIRSLCKGEWPVYYNIF